MDEMADLANNLWDDNTRLRLLKLYTKSLSTENKKEALQQATQYLRFHDNPLFTEEIVAAELSRLRNFGNEMMRLEDCEVEFPMMDEIKLMLCLEGTAPMRLVEEYLNDCNGVQWSEDETRELLEAYLDTAEDASMTNTQWTTIYNTLSRHILDKYSKTEIRRRVNRLKSKYNQIRHRMQPEVLLEWPLHELLEKLLMLGKSAHELYKEDTDGSEEAVESTEQLRWTYAETKSLLEAYRRYVEPLLRAVSFKDKRKVWCRISAEVKMGRMRKCNPYLCRMKVENLKKTYRKQITGKGRSSWPYYSLMVKTMKYEEKAKNRIEGNDEDLDVQELVEVEPRNPVIPQWLHDYNNELKQMHAERMELKLRFFNLIERILSNSQKRLV